MNDLEIIAIRCAGIDGKEKAREVLKTIERVQGAEGPMGITMYSNASSGTDLSILVIGASCTIGKAVVNALSSRQEIISASRSIE